MVDNPRRAWLQSLLTGDLNGALNDVKDIGSDLKDSGKNVINTVTDFF